MSFKHFNISYNNSVNMLFIVKYSYLWCSISIRVTINYVMLTMKHKVVVIPILTVSYIPSMQKNTRIFIWWTQKSMLSVRWSPLSQKEWFLKWCLAAFSSSVCPSKGVYKFLTKIEPGPFYFDRSLNLFFSSFFLNV